MGRVRSCFFITFNLSRVLPLTAIACALLTSSQAAEAPIAENRNEQHWFVFLGGSLDMPVWTACRGTRYQDVYASLYVHQINSSARLMEAALGVRDIVVPPGMAFIPMKNSSTDSQLFSADQLFFPDKLSPEELSSVLLQSVRNCTSSPDPLILELQPSLKSIFSDAYLTYYSEPPAVLCIVRHSQNAKQRLCRLTQRLSEIGDMMRRVTGQTNVLSMTLSETTDLETIEAFWRSSILKPFDVEPKSIKIWKSFSTVEFVFSDDFPFGTWAEIIAGSKLGGVRSSDENFNLLLRENKENATQ